MSNLNIIKKSSSRASAKKEEKELRQAKSLELVDSKLLTKQEVKKY